MSSTEREETGSVDPTIRRGRVDSLDLYEITEHELDILERGSPGSTELNFSVALLSAFLTLFVALLTTTPSDTVFQSFVLAALVSLVLGLYMLVRWLRTRTDLKHVVQKIRSRIPDANRQLSPPPPPAAGALPSPDTEAEQAG